MTREEAKARLEELGAPYVSQWGQARLDRAVAEAEAAVPAVPAYTDEQVARIAREVSGADRKPIEAVLGMTSRVDGEATTRSGIVVPGSVLAGYSQTRWEYALDRGADSVRVYRFTKNGYNEDVRTYVRGVHGVGYAELASDFVRKKNQ